MATTRHEGEPRPIGLPLEYVFLIISGVLLLLGFVLFAILPPEVPIREYRTSVLSFLAALAH